MGDANEGIGWLMQRGIWDLFDPDIEGAVKNGCTHMLLSPFLLMDTHRVSRTDTTTFLSIRMVAIDVSLNPEMDG